MKKKVSPKPVAESSFESLVVSIVQIHQQAQEFATKAVNVGLTLRNWFIGHRIVEFEQKGADRAAGPRYGENAVAWCAWIRLYSCATTSGFAAATSSCSVGSVSTLNRQPAAALPFGGGLPGTPQS